MRRHLLVLAALPALAFACQRAEPTPGAATSGPRYSPFVVHVSGADVPFDVISFKDVGLHRPHPSEEIYEVVAESLSLELQREAPTRLHSEVLYSAEITDPRNHAACEGQHIYVDLWSSPDADRYGYSLWSGCGDDDNFAWRELPFTPDTPREQALQHLSTRIAADLREAVRTGCFSRAC